MSSPSPVPAVKPARYLYFVNAPVDYAVIGGASVALYLGLTAAGERADTPLTVSLGYWLSWVVNWPHFSATNYRLYHSRANIAQYPITALVVPVLLMAGVLASFMSPEGVAPFFVKLFLLWSPYHFSGQSLGISLIYARRAGFVVGRIERLAFSGFIFGTFFLSTARAEATPLARPLYGIEVPSLGLPTWVAPWAEWGMYAFGAGLFVVVLRWCIINRRILPPIVLLPALSQFIWFIPGASITSFSRFVPFFHSLQYLLIAWSMQLKEQMDTGARVPSGRFVLGESAKWGVINLLGGVALFYLLPRAGTLLGYPIGFTEPVLISAVQIHHFFVDGVIWKLKNPRVGSPLLVNIEQLLRPEAESARQPA